MRNKLLATLALALLSTLNRPLSTAFAQGTAFTYQGRLNNNGALANGNYEFQFVLFSTNQSGSPVGPVPTANAVVSNGLFTVTLDFGGIFTGTNYWLDIFVRTNGAASFTELQPRQPVTPTPYAVFAEKVGSGGLAAGTYGNAVTFSNTANNFSGSFTGNGSALTSVNAATLGGLSSSNFWKVGGNAGTSTNFIGTTDGQPFDVRVNNVRVMRYQLGTDAGGSYTNAPNIVGGSSVNSATNTVVGATIGGGGANDITGGSYPNKVTADFGTVSGGLQNTASNVYATVSGGIDNSASYSATVAGGHQNTASGAYATVPGGELNTASGDYSFASGFLAHANHDGSFVWADHNLFTFSSTMANQFRVRATGGAAFVTAIDGGGGVAAGVHVLAGDTAWSSISDKNAKKNFQPLNGEAVLEKLAAIPVEKWNYKWESDTNTPHIGPMAQDFKGAFYPGRDDKSISTLEFDGIELAAIQGLNQKLEEKDARIRALEKQLSELKQAVNKLTGTKD